MAKKVNGYVKLQVPAGAANPAPPIGPALGQQGVNIMEFCKQFNAATQKVEKNLPIPVIITVYSDRSFTFIMKTPPASVLIRKAIGIEKGSGTPNTAKVGKITRKQLEEIAKTEDAGPHGRRSRRARFARSPAPPVRWAWTWWSKSWQSQNVKRPGRTRFSPGKQYSIDDALKMVKEFATAKFNETVDCAVNLGIDAAKSDQQVRGSTVMPHGTGKTLRVAVFTAGKNVELAKAAGADIVGMEDLAAQVKAGEINFDRVIASPDAMRVVGQLGQILGPARTHAEPEGRHRDPGRRHGGEERQGRPGHVPRGQGRNHPLHHRQVEVRGRRSSRTTCIALINDLNKAKPATSKGIYLKKITVSSTMGPGVVVDQGSLGL